MTSISDKRAKARYNIDELLNLRNSLPIVVCAIRQINKQFDLGKLLFVLRHCTLMLMSCFQPSYSACPMRQSGTPSASVVKLRSLRSWRRVSESHNLPRDNWRYHPKIVNAQLDLNLQHMVVSHNMFNGTFAAEIALIILLSLILHRPVWLHSSRRTLGDSTEL